MGNVEAETHSFIVKIWFEETSVSTGRALWRGHVTHVPGGERRYLQDLEEIASFILPYLEAMGVRISACERISQRLHRWKRWLEGRRDDR
jgi:hypothetical protein